MGNKNGHVREFGKFRLDAEKMVLWAEDRPVNLQLKEIELLCLLTERHGEILTKDEILDRVWADSFVEESNLAQHIYRLRKTFKELGETVELIQTVPRRGYRFVGEITDLDNGDLVIERHSFSKTFIQEIENSEEPNLIDIQAKVATQTARPQSLPIVIGACLLAAIAVGVYAYNSRLAGNGQPIRSIAILPLRSLSGDNEKAIGLGFADALITNLGKLNEIKILSIAAVSSYTDEKQEPLAIGRQLNVDAVLEGTLQRSENSLRVNLRLLRTSDGKQIWSETFDQAEARIFEFQDEIALKTAAFLGSAFDLKNREATLKHYTENSEAYRAYQTGRYLHFQADYGKAIVEFELALKYDPKYALAYSGLADSHALLANRSAKEKRIENYEKAKSYASQALVLDNNLAEAHASLGWIRRIYDWDWAESEKHLRRAIELDPNFAAAYARLAFLYITLGKTGEAVRLSQQASQLNPVNHSPSWALYCNRQYEESVAEYLRRTSLPGSPEVQNDARVGAAMAYSEVGKYAEAITLLEQIPDDFQDDYKVTVAIAIAYRRAGQAEKASELLKKLEQKAETGQGYSVRLASVYAAMERNEDAIKQLQKGFAERDDRMMWLKATPHFDQLRSDPRFQEILHKMNL